MCGRFVAVSSADELSSYFEAIFDAAELEARFNVAPTAQSYTVVAEEGRRSLKTMRWGLIPFWAKDQKIGNSMFNARTETVATKNVFKRAYETRRCLVPVDGFYEWKREPIVGDATLFDTTGIDIAGESPEKKTRPQKTNKTPYYFFHSGSEPLVLAGLWESWRPKSQPAMKIESFTILTCEANADIAPIHDRMPVVLPPSAWDLWMSPQSPIGSLSPFLKAAPEELISSHPVTDLVNNSSHDGPELVEPLSPI